MTCLLKWSLQVWGHHLFIWKICSKKWGWILLPAHGNFQELGLSNDIIRQALHKLQKAYKDSWEVPRELTTQQQTNHRVERCKTLLENSQDWRFFKRIVTCDEKWIYETQIIEKKWLCGPINPTCCKTRVVWKVYDQRLVII